MIILISELKNVGQPFIIETSSSLLLWILGLNLFAILFLSIFESQEKPQIYTFSISITSLIFFITMYCFKHFYKNEICGFQLTTTLPLLSIFNCSFKIGVDGLSLCFLTLTTFIIPICIAASDSVKKNYKWFIIYLLIIEFSLILTFISLDLFLFYISFETVLIPMFLMLLHWGSKQRKFLAAYYLFLYTLIGSFFLLIALLWLYLITGSTKFEFILYMQNNVTVGGKGILFILLLIPFAIKLPLFPFHLWLAEAHVEAPTVGSILLASLLLKLGGYGLFRFLFFVAKDCYNYHGYLFAMAITGLIFGSLSTIRQIDLKRAVAYSSIAHMNLTAIAIFTLTKQSWHGALYMMIGHAFVSSAMFFCVGVLYNRHHTRLIRYYGGLVHCMPLFSIFFFIFTIANMSFPGTCNFIGEFLMFLGIADTTLVKEPFLLLFFAGFGIVLSAVYSIYLFNRLIFGTVKINYISKFNDLTMNEFTILSLLTFLVLLFGLNSELINWIQFSIPYLK